jgi:group I intron endonuclease
MVKSGIYIIFSQLKSERFYIGSALNLRERKWNHFSNLKNNKHPNKIIQNHYNKYGIEDLQFEILEYVEDKTKLIEREQFYIDELKPYFNICKIAGRFDNMWLGKHHSEETRIKMSKSAIGKNIWTKDKPKSEEHKRKISNSHIGLKRSDKSIEKQKETCKNKRLLKFNNNEKF